MGQIDSLFATGDGDVQKPHLFLEVVHHDLFQMTHLQKRGRLSACIFDRSMVCNKEHRSSSSAGVVNPRLLVPREWRNVLHIARLASRAVVENLKRIHIIVHVQRSHERGGETNARLAVPVGEASASKARPTRPRL